jgi:hypothetical protein
MASALRTPTFVCYREIVCALIPTPAPQLGIVDRKFTFRNIAYGQRKSGATCHAWDDIGGIVDDEQLIKELIAIAKELRAAVENLEPVG